MLNENGDLLRIELADERFPIGKDYDWDGCVGRSKTRSTMPDLKTRGSKP